MKAVWKKYGLLYKPIGGHKSSKLFSHAANPLPVLIQDDTYRIFFSSRDVNNYSSVGAVDIDIVKREIIQEYSKPFFEYGSEGTYYSNGVSIGNCYKVGDTSYMLFMGWSTSPEGHWRGDIGRLIVKQDMTLELFDDEPMMGLDATDMVSLSYPWVMPCDAGGYHMWYGSTVIWDAGNGEMLHVINYASSTDGDAWHRHGGAVPYKIGVAQAFSRPTVIREKDGSYSMWFSYRSGTGEKYRIGYAKSQDAKNWVLDMANSGIDVSQDGWDADMIEYPYVFDHKGERYMLYNGNGYGESGFGLAVLLND